MSTAIDRILSIILVLGLIGCRGGIKFKASEATANKEQPIVTYQPGAKVVVEDAKSTWGGVITQSLS